MSELRLAARQGPHERSPTSEGETTVDVDARGAIVRVAPVLAPAEGLILPGSPLAGCLSPNWGVAPDEVPLHRPEAFVGMYLHHRGVDVAPTHVVIGADYATDGDRALLSLRCRSAGRADAWGARVLAAARYEVVGRLASGVAHELNNILSTVTTFSDLLLARASPGSGEAADLTEIRESATEAAAVLRKLDLFAGGRAKGAQRVHVQDVINGLAKLIRRFLPGEVTLDIEVEDECPPVHVDPLHLEEAILALIANARDALNGAGSLGVRCAQLCSAGVQFVRIEVEDSGGAAPPSFGYLSTPFLSTDSLDYGLGLGIGLVSRFAASVGGRMDFETRGDGGSVAMLDIPSPDGGDVSIDGVLV